MRKGIEAQRKRGMNGHYTVWNTVVFIYLNRFNINKLVISKSLFEQQYLWVYYSEQHVDLIGNITCIIGFLTNSVSSSPSTWWRWKNEEKEMKRGKYGRKDRKKEEERKEGRKKQSHMTTCQSVISTHHYYIDIISYSRQQHVSQSYQLTTIT